MFAASLLMAGAFCSCSEKESEPTTDGDYIDFTVGGTDSRTVRADGNKAQINWENGDKIRILSDKATTSKGYCYADYSVNVSETNASKGTLAYVTDGLQWKPNAGEHAFYAIYPSTAALSYKDGVVTLGLPVNQKAKITSSTEFTEGSGDKERTKHHYVCAPEMTNSYLVATAKASGGQNVKLEFSPIMTTLDVTLANTGSDTITVTGIEIIDAAATYDGNDAGTFQYKVSDGSIASTTTGQLTTFVEMEDQEGNTFIDLMSNETLKLTVFLQPTAIDKNHQVSVQVHTTGTQPKVVALGGNVQEDKTLAWKAGELGSVKLNIRKNANNNWISNIPDNTYISQLSIPGTNMSASRQAPKKDDANYQGQTLTFTQQLQQGVRAFDFNLLYQQGGNPTVCFVDGTKTDYSLKTVLSDLSTYLTKNPKEAVFILFRMTGASTDKNDFGADFEASVNNVLVQWKPDLTIGECRGKMVVAYYAEVDYNRTKPAWITDGMENSSSIIGSTTLTGTNKTFAPLYYFAGNSDKNYTIQQRKNNIEIYFNKLKNGDTDSPNNTWGICFLGGYDKNTSTTYFKGCIENAKAIHPVVYKYLRNQMKFGPLGVVYIDWLGLRRYGDDLVYSDVLAQKIIDQNSRFTLKHK